jgi:pimeloyl-ACP methyl ester carboxylesterase
VLLGRKESMKGKAVTEPILQRTFTLHDGRVLAYAEFGSPKGIPVFHFHAGGSSRLDGVVFAKAALDLDVRLIAVDRPGIGGSEYYPSRKLLDWPDDILQLADALGIEQFAVEGISGGAPYALACAFKLPERVTACGVISGMVPVELVTADLPRSLRGFYGIRYWAAPFRALSKVVFSVLKSRSLTDRLLRLSGRSFTAADRTIIETPEIREKLLAACIEGARQGSRGSAADALIVVNPWGFDIRVLSGSRTVLWHGTEDGVVPIAAARLVSNAIPDCRGNFLQGEGHLSLSVNNAETILSSLLRQARP